MKRSLLEIYGLVACILLGLYALLLVGGSVSNLLVIANPAWAMTGTADAKYFNNDAFCSDRYNECSGSDVMSRTSATMCSEQEDCAKKNEEMLAQEKREEAERKAATSPEAITKKRIEAMELKRSCVISVQCSIWYKMVSWV